jgi:hypothetical protein
MLTRSSAMSFVSGVCVLTCYVISRSYLDDLKDERIGAILDPFGVATFRFLTKYWTSTDTNRMLALATILLWRNGCETRWRHRFRNARLGLQCRTA